MIILENEQITVAICEVGGVLCSIYSKGDNLEYLWQGKEGKGKSFPNLFPFVGRLYKRLYTLYGVPYEMEMHGFLQNMCMVVEERGKDFCVLACRDTPKSRSQYPYKFIFRIEYALEKNRVNIRFEVENRTDVALFCAWGGHPGFRVPLEEGLSFEDYSLHFPESCEPKQIVFSEDILCTGEQIPYPLKNGTELALRRELFMQDAVVLAQAPRAVSLKTEKGVHGICVEYPDMPYVALWQIPGADTQFLCIEPWSCLPGQQGKIEEVTRMEEMLWVEAGMVGQAKWSICVW